jgi:subfamily B ATP-binding cassette protein HlyB/CyaB
LKSGLRAVRLEELPALPLPFIATVSPSGQPAIFADPRPEEDGGHCRLAVVFGCDPDSVTYLEEGAGQTARVPLQAFGERFLGEALLFAPAAPPLKDEDAVASGGPAFGFRWFLPELLRHRGIWRDVLLASLAIQLMALATPVFTQIVIDKVIVHHTLSTLAVIAVALGVFILFTAAMSWVRQYLVLHTGNRIDAVLGSRVFDHLFRLPPRYFEHRPTGVLVARVQGVETIREFLSSAAVTLILDVPFLFVFLAVMFHYSVLLTLVTVVVLLLMVALSFAVTPILRRRLNQQFLLGARNQAFLTEYVAGLETVKSLQLEPQLNRRFGDYLATYLQAGFRTRQLANTYNVAAHMLEQALTLIILCVGAWLVMTSQSFTIGMLVAFQMFAGRVSQPMLHLAGLWQQFQQADIAVRRLGDIMNAPPEPYTSVPMREAGGAGKIEIRNLAFRYADNLPYLFHGFNLVVEPGRCVAVTGPSGCGKSTLAKLLQGFYQPDEGGIAMDGRDIRHLGANELRSHYGVVPQETVLFSGTIYDNLVLASPHSTFDEVVHACKLAEIHETIERLPQGYRTAIGEHGAGLSGGQKQRIAIARALLKRPRILIFDEATSSLDPAAAEQFARTVNRFRGRVTMIFIAHHLPSGLLVDRVVTLGAEEARLNVVGEECKGL